MFVDTVINSVMLLFLCRQRSACRLPASPPPPPPVTKRRTPRSGTAAATAGSGPVPVPSFVGEESRALADVARDSLSNLSLILGKTGPALDAPGLVAHCCGLGEGSTVGDSSGGGGGGVLVAMVDAFSGGEEKMLPHLCRLFEVGPLLIICRLSFFILCSSLVVSWLPSRRWM